MSDNYIRPEDMNLDIEDEIFNLEHIALYDHDTKGTIDLLNRWQKMGKRLYSEIEKLNIALDFSISRNKRLTASIEKLKAESQANLDGWKQARRIIEKMNKRLRK